MSEQPPPSKRSFEILAGGIVAAGGLGLLGFALVVAYADLVRDSPSVWVVNGVIALCSGAGIFCALAGARLISGKKTRLDGVLLAKAAWGVLSVFFTALAIVLLLSRRLVPAFAAFWLAVVCYALRRALLQSSPD